MGLLGGDVDGEALPQRSIVRMVLNALNILDGHIFKIWLLILPSKVEVVASAKPQNLRILRVSTDGMTKKHHV